jgi:hypothetical protein
MDPVPTLQATQELSAPFAHLATRVSVLAYDVLTTSNNSSIFAASPLHLATNLSMIPRSHFAP